MLEASTGIGCYSDEGGLPFQTKLTAISPSEFGFDIKFADCREKTLNRLKWKLRRVGVRAHVSQWYWFRIDDSQLRPLGPIIGTLVNRSTRTCPPISRSSLWPGRLAFRCQIARQQRTPSADSTFRPC